MHYLSLCGIVKDEPDLIEWISYHRAIGVEHFYLYDNGSKIPVAKTLAPLIARKIVDVMAVPGVNLQATVYGFCTTQRAAESEFIAFLDADEYLWIADEQDHPPNDAQLLMARIPSDAPGLVLNWAMFGTSGIKHRPAGLVMENFVMRAALDYPLHQFVKSIVHPKAVSYWTNSHFAYYHGDVPAVNTAGRKVRGPFTRTHFDTARINHYVTKAQQEYLAKIPLRRPDGSYRDVTVGHYEQNCNAVLDRSIIAWSKETKRMMGECI